VLLLTPALFDEGAVPERIHGARVLAAAVGRPLTFSGWNLEKGKVGPKPSRRAAASGSVYWVELDPGADPAAWIRGVHLHTINSNPQDDRDGFGLAVVGAWT
jgi:CRISPR-associated protein Cmr3